MKVVPCLLLLSFSNSIELFVLCGGVVACGAAPCYNPSIALMDWDPLIRKPFPYWLIHFSYKLGPAKQHVRNRNVVHGTVNIPFYR